MTLPDLDPTILLFITRNISTLLLETCGGDEAKATEAAAQAIAIYSPRNENEILLAARIAALNLHASHALAKAARPETPKSQAARLRGSALAMIREADKAERHLRQLQDAPEPAQRVENASDPDTAPIPDIPAAEPALKEPAPQQAPQAKTLTKEELRDIRLCAQRNRIPFAQALAIYKAAPSLDERAA